MAPFVEAGQIRPMPMLVLNAVVSGPTHAIARQWLAGPASEPLRSYLEQLADAAAAALSGPAAALSGPAAALSGPAAALSGPPAATARHRDAGRHGRMRLQIVSDDGSILAEGEATMDLLPSRAETATSARLPPGS